MKKFDYKAKDNSDGDDNCERQEGKHIMIVPVLLPPYSKLLFAVYIRNERAFLLPSSYFHLRGGRQRHKLPFLLIYPFYSH